MLALKMCIKIQKLWKIHSLALKAKVIHTSRQNLFDKHEGLVIKDVMYKYEDKWFINKKITIITLKVNVIYEWRSWLVWLTWLHMSKECYFQEWRLTIDK